MPVSLVHYQASEDYGQTVSAASVYISPVDRPISSIPPCMFRIESLYTTMNTLNSLYNFVESWIEISSRPSSSSVSSAATDHSLPPTHHLEPSAFTRRRRRLNRAHSLPYQSLAGPASNTGSSQDEYDESESESDRIMTSSNEGLAQNIVIDTEVAILTSSASEAASAEEEEEDDGDNNTALGIATAAPVFTPQPNVFSQPPQSQSRRTYSGEQPTSYFQYRRQSGSRPTTASYSNRKSNAHDPLDVRSASHQVDHDAALRASLSTLLSCAAAARSLPKKEQATAEPIPKTEEPPAQEVKAPAPLTTPYLVRETALVEKPRLFRRPSIPRVSSSSMHSLATSQKPKRKASSSKDRQNIKRKRRSSFDENLISPTLMTWMVSAGVVAIFSAISFSAGYVMGKEVGRLESAGTAAAFPSGSSCGKEMGRGLKRLRWSSSNSILKA